jgi:hypothetical protein
MRVGAERRRAVNTKNAAPLSMFTRRGAYGGIDKLHLPVFYIRLFRIYTRAAGHSARSDASTFVHGTATCD